jgi:hypothetical protein
MPLVQLSKTSVYRTTLYPMCVATPPNFPAVGDAVSPLLTNCHKAIVRVSASHNMNSMRTPTVWVYELLGWTEKFAVPFRTTRYHR